MKSLFWKMPANTFFPASYIPAQHPTFPHSRWGWREATPGSELIQPGPSALPRLPSKLQALHPLLPIHHQCWWALPSVQG